MGGTGTWKETAISSAFYSEWIALAGCAKEGLQGARVKAGHQALNYCSLINIEHLGKTCLQPWPVIKRLLGGAPGVTELLLSNHSVL